VGELLSTQCLSVSGFQLVALLFEPFNMADGHWQYNSNICGRFLHLGQVVEGEVKVKVHTLDIVPLYSESPLQKLSDMARVLKDFDSFTCTPTPSSAIGMSHTSLCLPSCSWYSFTDPGGMEG